MNIYFNVNVIDDENQMYYICMDGYHIHKYFLYENSAFIHTYTHTHIHVRYTYALVT